MWIFDSYYKGCVELWGRERGLARASIAYPPSFYMHLKDAPAHREMIEALESRYRAEERRFRTIFGTFEGHRVYAGRQVAEKIEMQTHYQVELYNVDVRQDQRYMAERDMFPCGDKDESRFSPDFGVPLSTMEMQIPGDPYRPREISCIDAGSRRLHGPERQVLSDLMELVRTHDPDLVLLPFADTWIPLIVQKAKRYGLEATISRSGQYKQMASKSYWS